MESLFNNEIVKKGDSAYLSDYKTLLPKKTDVTIAEVGETVDFLNNYFLENYKDSTLNLSPLSFRNGYCAYFAAMLNLIYPSGVMTINDEGDHVIFVTNTNPYGPIAFDSQFTSLPEDAGVKSVFSPEHDFLLYERSNQKEMEKICLEAVKAYLSEKKEKQTIENDEERTR